MENNNNNRHQTKVNIHTHYGSRTEQQIEPLTHNTLTHRHVVIIRLQGNHNQSVNLHQLTRHDLHLRHNQSEAQKVGSLSWKNTENRDE